MKLICVADEFARARRKDTAGVLYLSGTFQVKIT